MIRRFISTLAVCAVLAGCASDNAGGIGRSAAIAIAENHCSQYPEPYGVLEGATWMPDGGYWLVTLTDDAEVRGRAYKVSGSGEVLDSGDVKLNGDATAAAGHPVYDYYW